MNAVLIRKSVKSVVNLTNLSNETSEFGFNTKFQQKIPVTFRSWRAYRSNL